MSSHFLWGEGARRRVLNESYSELEFLKSLWGLVTEEEQGYRTGPPGYIGWRNSFLGIDSWAPQTFKNTGSDCLYLCRDLKSDCILLSAGGARLCGFGYTADCVLEGKRKSLVRIFNNYKQNDSRDRGMKKKREIFKPNENLIAIPAFRQWNSKISLNLLQPAFRMYIFYKRTIKTEHFA